VLRFLEDQVHLARLRMLGAKSAQRQFRHAADHAHGVAQFMYHARRQLPDLRELLVQLRAALQVAHLAQVSEHVKQPVERGFPLQGGGRNAKNAARARRIDFHFPTLDGLPATLQFAEEVEEVLRRRADALQRGRGA
jgi:hypothetical protein